jgi:hypothetical protein
MEFQTMVDCSRSVWTCVLPARRFFFEPESLEMDAHLYKQLSDPAKENGQSRRFCSRKPLSTTSALSLHLKALCVPKS